MKARLRSIFTGEEGDSIPLQAAFTATTHFQNLYPSHRPSYFLSTAALHTLLARPHCVGIRAYFGMMDSGDERLVAVGTDAFANDLLDGPIMVSALKGFPSPFPTLGDWGSFARLLEQEVYQLDRATAALLTANFRERHSGQTWGVFWGLQRIAPYLVETECLGLRFYPYADAHNRVSLFYTAVNSLGADMLSPHPLESSNRVCLTQCATGVNLFGFSLTTTPASSEPLRRSA